MTEQVDQKEAGRARVRRLVLEPLQELGFKFKRGTQEEIGRKRLAQICDDIGYLSDQNLERLLLVLRDKGEGSARCFWPERATIIAFAQLVQPRPIEDMPGLRSWFASAAGKAALEGGRLVAEYRWWKTKHRPPMNARERKLVSDWARDWNSDRTLFLEKIDRGFELPASDAAWLRAYEADLQSATALVAGGQA